MQTAIEIFFGDGRIEQLLAEQKKSFEAREVELKQEVEEKRRSVELLETNLQSLGVRYERLAKSVPGTDSALEMELAPSGSASSHSSISGLPPDVQTEITELRTSERELREVLLNTKKDRDRALMALTVKEAEWSRQCSALAATQRQLDETRAELKKSNEKSVTARSEDEFTRLLGEVSQLNVLRESNEMLRQEKTEIAGREAQLREELKREKDGVAPLHETVRKLTADNKALELDNDALENDLNCYRERIQVRAIYCRKIFMSQNSVGVLNILFRKCAPSGTRWIQRCIACSK